MKNRDRERLTNASLKYQQLAKFPSSDFAAEDEFCRELSELIREVIPLAGRKNPARTKDEDDPTDSGMLRMYNRIYLRGILNSIRKGYCDYVYDVYTLCELYSYEPGLEFMLRDGAFYVKLKGAWD